MTPLENSSFRKTSCLARLLMAVGCLACAQAFATTEGETQLANLPLPHEHLGTGANPVQVHWTRLRGYFEDARGHAGMLDELKAQVRSCVQAAQQAGRVSRPPQLWPEYVSILQRDTYDSVNRSISYATTLLYTVNPADCSLVENRRTVATLSSTKGVCEIDLGEKKAHGFCDARAHAAAAPLTRTGHPVSSAGSIKPPLISRAAQEALDKAMKQTPGRTGESKIIAGIKCEVWRSAFDPNGSACLSVGGSFVASHAALWLNGSSMELEIGSTLGLNLRAVKAALDAKVNPAVFAPHLSDGFDLRNAGGRK